jgi:Glycosyl transferase family 2
VPVRRLLDEPARIAVLVPCRNEELTIGGVVSDFRRALPDAVVYVYDNNSEDRSAVEARTAGAVVRRERLQGKGRVVRRMFADVEADAYVLVDGDGTYEAKRAAELVSLVTSGEADMVSGARRPLGADSYRPGHQHGNRALTWILARLFRSTLRDLLSGYKVLSRRFVKSFPALSRGFEIETEMAVHALSLGMPIAEVDVPYGARPPGSESKLSTCRDGVAILRTIGNLVRQERPLAFFSLVGAVLVAASLALGIPLLVTFADTGLVPKLPSAVLACGIMVLAFLSFVAGLILDTVTRGRRELKLLQYMNVPMSARPDESASAWADERIERSRTQRSESAGSVVG